MMGKAARAIAARCVAESLAAAATRLDELTAERAPRGVVRAQRARVATLAAELAGLS